MDDSTKDLPKHQRSLIGKVVSDKRDKTVAVLIERKAKHAKYGKYENRSRKYHAHDNANACKEGDLVEIQECRPISKTVNWVVARVVQSAAQM